MIPITQTKVVVKNSKGEMVVRGNCWAACIASLLELPIEEVPNVEVFFDHETFWYDAMVTFLDLKGYSFKDSSNVFAMGLEIENYEHDKFYLVAGKSVRGVAHSVIYQNGKMVHDPHPTREGLLPNTIFEIKTLELITHSGGQTC